MSGLSITDVISRNRPPPSSLHSYGSGFLFYLRHYLIEETEHSVSQVHHDSAVQPQFLTLENGASLSKDIGNTF